MSAKQVAEEVVRERARQDELWGEQNHENGTGRPGSAELRDRLRSRCDERFAGHKGAWDDILVEEVAEALAESDPTLLRAELIQIAAVAVAWAEAIDRKAAKDEQAYWDHLSRTPGPARGQP